MEVFEDQFQRFEVGTQGSLILADDSGLLLARRPVAPGLVGTKVLSEDGALGQLRSGVNAGVRLRKAPVDGVPRMLGFERVGATRLVVANRSPERAAALAAWTSAVRSHLEPLRVRPE